MKTFIAILGFTIAFAVGLSVNSFVNAQNQTTTTAPIVVSIDTLIYVVIIPIVISVLGIIKSLVDKGYLSKKIGTVAVMAGDTAHAVEDTRGTVNRLGQATYDTVKLSNPEAVKYADEKIAPVIDESSRRLSEYKPKVDTFGDIASDLSDKGKKADPKIEEMKDEIPDRIVPS